MTYLLAFGIALLSIAMLVFLALWLRTKARVKALRDQVDEKEQHLVVADKAIEYWKKQANENEKSLKAERSALLDLAHRLGFKQEMRISIGGNRPPLTMWVSPEGDEMSWLGWGHILKRFPKEKIGQEWS